MRNPIRKLNLQGILWEIYKNPYRKPIRSPAGGLWGFLLEVYADSYGKPIRSPIGNL